MSVSLFGGFEVVGVLYFPRVGTGLTRFSFVFTVPGIVLVVGREDDFSPSVKDVDLIVGDKIW
jgi:hypothetical protein